MMRYKITLQNNGKSDLHVLLWGRRRLTDRPLVPDLCVRMAALHVRFHRHQLHSARTLRVVREWLCRVEPVDTRREVESETCEQTNRGRIWKRWTHTNTEVKSATRLQIAKLRVCLYSLLTCIMSFSFISQNALQKFISQFLVTSTICKHNSRRVTATHKLW